MPEPYSVSLLNDSFPPLIDGVANTVVNYARELLRSTDRTVTEIAYDCGFDSPRTFNRAFLKVYGENPRACRRAAGR